MSANPVTKPKVIQDATITLAQRLSTISAESENNPFRRLSGWEKELAPEAAWHMHPELISLQGMPEYEALDEAQRRRLSFFEAVNFYSLNVHGERSLMEGLAERLYRKWPGEISTYLHHFLAEENNHMVLFGGFCQRYAGKIYPDRHLNIPREYAPGEKDFLFFAKVQVFEEIVDYYNYLNAGCELLHPISREINHLHRVDEARHLAFGRKMVADLYTEYAPRWNEETRTGISAYLEHYIVATLKEYCNPDVYRDAGFPEPYKTMNLAWEAPSSQVRREKATAKLRNFFHTRGILKSEVSL